MKRCISQKILVLAFALGLNVLAAQPSPDGILLPPLSPSPIDIFRRLLATNEAGRAQFMAGKSAAAKQYLESRIDEFESMPVEQREAKLQWLELRWYMPPMMKLKPTERAPRLAAMPEPLRAIIQPRLLQWDILPPGLQQEILDNEVAIQFFERPEHAGTGQSALAAMSVEQRSDLEQKYQRWMTLSETKREQIMASFENFVEMPDPAKSNTLAKLTETERAQMQQTLAQFSTLPKEQRQQAMQGFRKFAELLPEERAAFLKTAERWRTMSERDRDLWRKIVARVEILRITPPPSLPVIIKPVESTTLLATNN